MQTGVDLTSHAQLHYSGELLPLDQPLFDASGRWAFMLHMREGVQPATGPYPGYPQPVIQLATSDLAAAIERLRAADAEILPCDDARGRRCVAFREPFGTPIEVIELP